MPTLATGIRQAAESRTLGQGRFDEVHWWPTRFSLIELLVAVFVIVLLTGVVSLNVGRGGAELELRG